MRFRHILLLLSLALPGSANQDPPAIIRAYMQLIEVPHATFTALMNGKDNAGPALHARVLGMTKSGKAKLVETSLITTRSGQRATIESVREEIYPTDYGLPSFGGPVILWKNPFTFPRGGQATPTAYETRNTGTTLLVEPSANQESKTIDLHFNPEIVDPLGLTTWSESRDRWGDNSCRMPEFETWKTNCSITLKSGRIELVTVFSPKPADEQSTTTRKILCFVRADIVSP